MDTYGSPLVQVECLPHTIGESPFTAPHGEIWVTGDALPQWTMGGEGLEVG